MSLILCIETGTDICSVGLAKDGELLSLRESGEGRDRDMIPTAVRCSSFPWPTGSHCSQAAPSGLKRA